MADYELVAREIEYSLSHGFKANAENGLKILKWNLSGYLKQYSGISDSVMTDVLRDACKMYGRERPNRMFIPFLNDYIVTYIRKNRIKSPMLSDEAKHMETIRSGAYRHNSFDSFNERDFTSTPEDLTVGYVDKQRAKAMRRAQSAPSAGFNSMVQYNAMPDDQDGNEAYMDSVELSDGELGPDDQTDDEISALIDELLGF